MNQISSKIPIDLFLEFVFRQLFCHIAANSPVERGGGTRRKTLPNPSQWQLSHMNPGSDKRQIALHGEALKHTAIRECP